MDLLSLIFDAKKLRNICCICLNCSKNCIYIFDIIEFVNKQSHTTISLYNIIKSMLPQQDIFLDYACSSCTDLIVQLYKILLNSNIKKNIFSSMLFKIKEKIDQFDHKSQIINLCLDEISIEKPNKDINITTTNTRDLKRCHKQTDNATICYICGKETKTRKQLKTHFNCHTLKECPYCFKTLKTHAHYYKHLKNHKIHHDDINKIDNNGDISIRKSPNYIKPNSMPNDTTFEQDCVDNPNKFSQDNSNTVKTYQMNIKLKRNIPTLRQLAYESYCNSIITKCDNGNHIRNVRETQCHKPKSYVKKFYLCAHCQYKSITKSNLEAHYNKIHYQIRPYICNICSKSFYRKSNLQEHVIIHDNKNIICEICGMNFVSKKTLKKHLESHKGVKKFHCDTCSKFFLNKSRLNEHIKRSHGEKMVNCVYCGKTYGLRKDLNRHVAKLHQIRDINLKVFHTMTTPQSQ